MADLAASPLTRGKKGGISRRDWVLLPLLSLCTILFIGASVKLIAEHSFGVSKTALLSCLVLDDPTTGVRAIPNSTCTEKISEGPATVYRFNNCGHRTEMECWAKDPGVYRIVLIGSSFNFGMRVQREESFAARLPASLSKQTGRRIDLYNESMGWCFPRITVMKLNDMFRAQPDVLLWLLTPVDIQNASFLLPDREVEIRVASGGILARAQNRFRIAFGGKSISEATGAIWKSALRVLRASPSGVLLQNVVYASQSEYLKSYLMEPDVDVGFLKTQPSAQWRDNLQEFSGYAAEVARRAAKAGVPLVVGLLPQRGQAALISTGASPAGIDPYKLNEDLRRIIVGVGGTYIDLLSDFRTIPNPEKYYFAVDGHLNSDGHSLFSRLLVKKLSNGPLAGLRESQTFPVDQNRNPGKY